MIRQGDLLIIKIPEVPKSALEKDSQVIAEGELSGHRHELSCGTVFEKATAMYFTVPSEEEAVLNHPEHFPVTFPPGHYKVIRQKEYFPGAWRHVQD